MKSDLLTIDELGKLDRGRSRHRPRDDKSLYGGVYPFIQTGDVKHSQFYITSYTQTYNEKGLSQSKLWDAGTLCITIAANISDTAILTFKACFPDSILGFIPYKDKSNVKFVKYCFNVYKTTLEAISKGTTQDNLSLDKLRKVKFKIPPLPIQRKIAAILSAYDDLIENNSRRIAILEKMAEELYREWFVRLRFPGHENVKIVKGVPEGWEVKSLADIVDITMGQSPSSEFYNTSGIGLPFNQGVGTYGNRFPKKDIYCNTKGRIAQKGNILFSVRAPVGRLNIADTEMVIGRGLAALNHKNCKNSYLYYLLRNVFSKEDVIGNGAIFNSVTKEELYKLKVFTPNYEIVEQFDNFAKSIDSKITLITKQNELLIIIRDRLLSRLMSGKLDVENLDIQFPSSMQDECNFEGQVAAK